MRWLDQRSWTSVETADSIVFTVIRDRGLLSCLAAPLMILFVFFVAHHYRSWFWFACGVIGLGSIIADWLHGNMTQLTVTPRELTVRGNVAKTFDDSILFSAQGLSSLTYYDGGEDDPSGLYAFSGISRTCLISGLNEQQSMEIALLIYNRFPDLESGDTNSGSLLFGDRGELTSLGLSKRK